MQINQDIFPMNESTQLISDLLAELTYMARQTQQSPSLDILQRARSFLERHTVYTIYKDNDHVWTYASPEPIQQVFAPSDAETA